MDNTAPPHDLQAERGALSCIWSAEPAEAADFISQLIPNHFYDVRHRELFVELCGLPADEIEIGRIKLVRGADTVAETAQSMEHDPKSGLMFPVYKDELERLTEFRDTMGEALSLANRCRDRNITADELANARLNFAFAEPQTQTTNSLSALLDSQFRPETLREAPPPMFSIGDAVISTPGNITAISAQAKAGKSAFVGAMLSATMTAPDGNADNFGITAGFNSGFVLHFDTEQSFEDHDRVMRTAMRRAGVETLPDSVKSFPLKGKTAAECRNAINMVCRFFGKESGKLHSVFIDGVADLVIDVNSQEECNPLVTELEQLAVTYSCSVVAVIHQNPGRDKTRGTLGSQIERKAESNIVLEKDGDTTVVYSNKQRRAPITKESGPRFAWSEEHGMHRSIGTIGEDRDTERVSQWKDEITDIFTDNPPMRYSDLLKAIPVTLGVAARTAERRFASWKKAKLIAKGTNNHWAPTFQA